VILAHHIADVVKQPLDESTVPQPMTVMVVSSTLASSSIGAVVMTSITITDERIAALLLSAVFGSRRH